MAFDSGGVTTGPMTVPFIMALGVGVSAIRSDRHAADDSFGLVALCSIGPILAVLHSGHRCTAPDSTYIPPVLPEVSDSVELWQLSSMEALPGVHRGDCFLPAAHRGFSGCSRLSPCTEAAKQLGSIAVGLAYTYVGLVLFLTGATWALCLPGNYLGQVLAGRSCPITGC